MGVYFQNTGTRTRFIMFLNWKGCAPAAKMGLHMLLSPTYEPSVGCCHFPPTVPTGAGGSTAARRRASVNTLGSSGKKLNSIGRRGLETRLTNRASLMLAQLHGCTPSVKSTKSVHLRPLLAQANCWLAGWLAEWLPYCMAGWKNGCRSD
jgi:hypothetical protein